MSEMLKVLEELALTKPKEHLPNIQYQLRAAELHDQLCIEFLATALCKLQWLPQQPYKVETKQYIIIMSDE